MLKKCTFLLTILLTLLIIPITASANEVVAEGACGQNVVWALTEDGTLSISGTGAMEDYSWTNFVPTTPWYQYRSSIKKIVVHDGVTSIGSSAFYKLSSVTSIELSNDVLALGSYAFGSCSRIQFFDFPDNLVYIADYCFDNCYNLRNASIPDTVTKLGDCVFTRCSNLETVDLPENMSVLPRGFFSECTSLESITLPDSITELASYCFRDCTGLKNITFPSAITTIGYRAFSGCTGIEEMALPNTITALSSEVFYQCSGLRKLTLSNNLSTIPESLCYGCSSLDSVDIPASVTKIEDFAFYGCSNLTSVIMHDALQEIGKSVFYNCTNLSSLILPGSITKIGDKAYGYYKNIFDEPDIVPNAKIYCSKSTAAESYAMEAGIPYSLIEILIDTLYCEYTGKPVAPPISITIDGNRLNEGSDFLTAYENNISIGTATVRITFTDNNPAISGTFAKTFRIGIPIQKYQIILEHDDYNCDIYLPNFSVSLDGKSLDLNEDFEAYYTLAGETWKKTSKYFTRQIWAPGKCTIRVVGINNYVGELIAIVNANPFFDVTESDFFYAPVLWAAGEGITSGTSGTTFSPAELCNRAQVVTFLWAAAGKPDPKSTENPFTDVPKGSFFEKAVLWAVENGITNGTDDTHFSPAELCNRATVVTFLWAAAGRPAVSGTSSFTDVPNGSWYAIPVLWAAKEGITSGVSPTEFGAAFICNRAQVVTFLYGIYHK